MVNATELVLGEDLIDVFKAVERSMGFLSGVDVDVMIPGLDEQDISKLYLFVVFVGANV